MSDLERRVSDLERRIADLERLWEVREDGVDKLAQAFGVTRNQARILMIIADGKRSARKLADELYATRADPPLNPRNVIYTQISKMRARLAARGVTIQSDYFGLWLDPDSTGRVRQAAAPP